MAITDFVWKTLEEQEKKVLDIPDRRVLHFASKLAFYYAMLDAAKDDPMDDPGDQAELLAHFEKVLKETVETYQELVNEQL
jgi:hypothetical protein